MTPGRVLRAGLLWEAALLALLGAVVCLWHGSPIAVVSFAAQAFVDLLLAALVLREPWDGSRAWMLRIIGALWLIVSTPSALAFGLSEDLAEQHKLLNVDSNRELAVPR